MDTSYLKGWSITEQNQRTKFMEHLYKCSGRTNGIYTGLWQDFCLKEAGYYCRNMWFEQQKAIEKFIKLEKQKSNEPFIDTFHD